jgi:membrane protein YdbS with pleckstrin-like domain
MKLTLAVAIFNLVAAAFCLVALVVDLVVGYWGFAAFQLALFCINSWLGYINILRYKHLKEHYHEHN